MMPSQTDQILPGVRVPRSMLRDPDGFGGICVADCRFGDLQVTNGVASGLSAASADCTQIVMPRLTEPHVHLDKCHTIDRIDGVGGCLTQAISTQWQDKSLWTPDDLRRRAGRGLCELAAAGAGAVRTHIDWGPIPDGADVPLAWEIIGELANANPEMLLQRSALVGVAELLEPEFARRIGKRLSADQGVLGSFVFGQPERVTGIQTAFSIAEQHGLALDFHVDEGLDPTLDGVELIADVALDHHHLGPILLGHACALSCIADDAFSRVADKLARAGISVTALPSTNLYLQGRGDPDPGQRGLTRIQALIAAGVNVVLGADNVRDAFCPIGRHDPRSTLSLAVLVAHLDPPLGNHLPMISTNARTALGMSPVFVDQAPVSELLVFDAASTSELLTEPTAPIQLADLLARENA